ncbi:hypothetical protein [Methanoregula sp.]|uniref:hypothetical protein n=1 Tax=Methanoregula sp. TaxID=2052170 RepID=UPI003C2281D2
MVKEKWNKKRSFLAVPGSMRRARKLMTDGCRNETGEALRPAARKDLTRYGIIELLSVTVKAGP